MSAQNADSRLARYLQERMERDTGKRYTLDEVLALFGYTREELLDEDAQIDSSGVTP